MFRGFLYICGFLALQGPLDAYSTQYKLGIGENVRKQDPPGGPYLELIQSLSNRTTSSDFIAHWFHQGWKTHFPVLSSPPAQYVSANCSGGGEYNNLASYQNVLNAGKRLVIMWWWHNDMPCVGSQRTDSFNTIRDCLVPMLNRLSNGEVYVVLEPEYNRYDACNAYSDPTWATHINSLIAQVRTVTGAGGLTVRVGPAVGDWAYDRSAYQVEGSLNAAMGNADFIAYHEIYRQNADHPTPNDTNFGNASPDQIEHALSYARYLKKRFGKPVLLPYQSVNVSAYGTAGQSDATLDFFRRRASLQAHDVEMFGPFWLFPDACCSGESLIDASNVQRPAFTTWRNEANAVIANTDRTHSIGFVGPDLGEVFTGMVNVQWISRGRPLTASTFNLDYSVNGGAFTSIATGLPGNDASLMSYSWDSCAVAPSADIRLRLTCPATGATVTSGRFAAKKASAVSNAQHTFEASAQGWVVAGTPGVALSCARVTGESWFHGASQGSLKVTCNFNGGSNGYIENTSPGITIAGVQRLTAMVYVPFDLNPCSIPGGEVSKVKFELQAGPYLSGPYILLQEGWNRVVWNFAGASGAVTYMKMEIYNKWGYTGNPAVYIDEIRVGDDLTFTGGTCASPTPSATSAGSSTITPTRTPSFTPAAGTPTATSTRTSSFTPAAGTPTRTPTASPSSTPAAACTPDYRFEGSTQGWLPDLAFDTGFTAVAASAAQFYEGGQSLQISANLTTSGASQTGAAYLNGAGNGFPKNLNGKTLSARLYVPATLSAVSWARLYVKDGSWAFNPGPTQALSNCGCWISLSFDLTSLGGVANTINEVGLQAGISGPPAFAGSLYLDAYDLGSACAGSPTPSSTRTPTSATSPTRTITRTQTPTYTPTSSPTRSQTPLSSPSASPSRTLTLSSTATPSHSPSRTFSPTASASASPSPQASPTQSPSRTLTGTFTRSLTDTSTLTATRTPTASHTLSATLSVTATQTDVPPGSSPTSSPTVSSSFSPSATRSASPTPSSTPTRTPSSSPSFTPSPPSTATLTHSHSPQFSPTHSPSVTPAQSSTATPSGSPTHTPSSTRTSTPSATPSPAAASSTQTGSPTPSPSSTPTPTASPTSGPALPSASPTRAPQGEVMETLPSFNPQAGPTLVVAARLSGSAEGFRLRVFTKAHALTGFSEVQGQFAPGWQSAAFSMPELSNGIYYYEISALNNGASSGEPRIGKLMILR